MSENYYRVLGIPENADEDTIAEAFQRAKAVVEAHTLRQKRDEAERAGDSEAIAKLNREIDRAEQHRILLNEAYHVLSDPTRRRYYDASLQHGQMRFTPENPSEHPSDDQPTYTRIFGSPLRQPEPPKRSIWEMRSPKTFGGGVVGTVLFILFILIRLVIYLEPDINLRSDSRPTQNSDTSPLGPILIPSIFESCGYLQREGAIRAWHAVIERGEGQESEIAADYMDCFHATGIEQFQRIAVEEFNYIFPTATPAPTLTEAENEIRLCELHLRRESVRTKITNIQLNAMTRQEVVEIYIDCFRKTNNERFREIAEAEFAYIRPNQTTVPASEARITGLSCEKLASPEMIDMRQSMIERNEKIPAEIAAAYMSCYRATGDEQFQQIAVDIFGYATLTPPPPP